MREITDKDRARFDQYVYPEPNSGCHLWAGSPGNGQGTHGAFSLGRGNILGAHRFAWLAAGRQIPPGMHVLHKCDVDCCVNVDHLYLGTQLDNNRDIVTRRRGRRGALPYGVYRGHGSNRFCARKGAAEKDRHLGTFDTIEEAAAVAAAYRDKVIQRSL